MADEQQQESQQSSQGTTSAGSGAAKAAAAAAATGVAALAARKALSSRQRPDAQVGNGGSTSTSGPDSLVSSMVSGGWEAARDQLLPLLEDAAGAAGKFVAHNAPDVVKERIVPRFIQSFNEASEQS
jgi:hypothetical protein